jgi:hypothetical protein
MPPIAKAPRLWQVLISSSEQVAIREDEVLLVTEFLDAAEDVVPAAAVESRRMLAQLVEDLLHLEAGEYGLDQHRRLDAALWHAQRGLRQHEGVVPEPRLQVRLHLRQVQVDARFLLHARLRVVKEVQPEIEQRAGHWRAVDSHVLFFQVPAARTHQQRGDPVVQPVLLALGTGEADRLAHRVAHVDLSLHLVVPGRRIRVFEVSHVHRRARVQRVDHHLAIGGTGDLHAAILQVLRHRRHFPVAVADVLRFFQEVR